MIKVNIKCFSQVKYIFEKDEFQIELTPGVTTFDLETIVRKKAKGRLDGIPLRIALNQKYQMDEIELQDGDEVALIPPVQGG